MAADTLPSDQRVAPNVLPLSSWRSCAGEAHQGQATRIGSPNLMLCLPLRNLVQLPAALRGHGREPGLDELARLDAETEVATLLAQLRFETGMMVADAEGVEAQVTVPMITTLPTPGGP